MESTVSDNEMRFSIEDPMYAKIFIIKRALTRFYKKKIPCRMDRNINVNLAQENRWVNDTIYQV